VYLHSLSTSALDESSGPIRAPAASRRGMLLLYSEGRKLGGPHICSGRSR
jgi:hypothetical protein